MSLWKFPYGYAKIELKCKRPERLINEALSCGLSLHNIERLSKNTVHATLCYSHLEDMHRIVNELDAEIRIISIGGASMLARSIINRKALFAVLISAVIAMLVLSKRVLFFDLNCDEPIQSDSIRSVLSDKGIVRGVPASQIDRSALEKAIADSDDCIDHASIVVDGVILRIYVYSRNNAAADDDPRPSSIYADKDCVIMNLAAFDGRAVVKAGDAVKKDQLLISGDITPEHGGNAVFVHSEAEIIGEVAYSLAVRIEPSELCPTRSGRCDEYASAELFGLKLDAGSPFVDSEAEPHGADAFDASFLPVILRRWKAHELVLSERKLSREEMLLSAEKRLQASIKAAVPEYAVIVSKSTDLYWEADGALTVRASVHTYEKIGYTRYL